MVSARASLDARKLKPMDEGKWPFLDEPRGFSDQLELVIFVGVRARLRALSWSLPKMANRDCKEPVAEACACLTVIEHHSADTTTSRGRFEPAQAAEVR
jgi:hypothetical protein